MESQTLSGENEYSNCDGDDHRQDPLRMPFGDVAQLVGNQVNVLFLYRTLAAPRRQ
jgi:hypothetical protein